MDRRTDLTRFPKIPCAAMMRPALANAIAKSGSVERPAGIRFEVIENSFGSSFCAHHQMDVRGSHMGCPQFPISVRANLTNRPQHHASSSRVQFVGLFIHCTLQSADPLRAGRKKRSAINVVISIHRATLVSIEPRAVAGEGEEVSERNRTCHFGFARQSRDRIRAATVRERTKCFSESRPRTSKPTALSGR